MPQFSLPIFDVTTLSIAIFLPLPISLNFLLYFISPSLGSSSMKCGEREYFEVDAFSRNNWSMKLVQEKFNSISELRFEECLLKQNGIKNLQRSSKSHCIKN